jgi:hypothetical protein
MAKPVSLFLAILMITIFTPCQTVLAKMVLTETVMESDRADEARVYVNSVLAREDLKAALMSHGIDMKEAKARIDSLSNTEIVLLADKIEQLPAGGDPLGTIIGAAVFIFVVLLITDILGLTDVFTFVKKS